MTTIAPRAFVCDEKASSVATKVEVLARSINRKKQDLLRAFSKRYYIIANTDVNVKIFLIILDNALRL